MTQAIPSVWIEGDGQGRVQVYNVEVVNHETLKFLYAVDALDLSVGDTATVWVTRSDDAEKGVDGYITNVEQHGTSYEQYEFTASGTLPDTVRE